MNTNIRPDLTVTVKMLDLSCNGQDELGQDKAPVKLTQGQGRLIDTTWATKRPIRAGGERTASRPTHER